MKKTMLRITALFLLSFTILTCASCNSGNTPSDITTTPETTISPDVSTSTPEETTTATETTAETTNEATTPAETTENNETPSATYPWAEVPETLKVLAIGNSFSTDAMQYLYDIAKSAGVKEIVLGNLYIGGCALATHLTHAVNDDGAYTYYKNTSGKWISTTSTKFSTGLTDEKWDIITLQQSSPLSGIESTYGKTLTSLIKIVNEKKTNPNARLYWHMTWAYQQNSTHSAFPTYSKDQQKMYNMIVSAVKNCILTVDDFSGVIPTGTAVQNARTSFVGDTITRDGYHMNYTLGRYLAGLTWFAALTGADISNIAYIPSADITPEVMAMAKDAVKAAMLEPLAVTESTHKTGTWSSSADSSSKEVVLPADCFERDRAAAESVGVDLTKYRIFEYEYLENTYYYCTKGTTTTTPSSSSSTYKQNICTKKIYSKTEIPENSIIICDAGWQYRPEMWVSLNAKAETRSGMVSALVTKLDSSFWGSSNYIAINIAASPKTDISTYYAAAASHVRIYVPVA